MNSNYFEREKVRLNRQCWRIWAQLQSQGKRDRCKGDLTSGWDWPTLCAVKPETANYLLSLVKQRKEMELAAKAAGLA